MKKIVVAVLMVLSFLSHADESCFYPHKADNGRLHYADNCGFIENYLACILFSENNTFYIHKSGASRHVYFFDNGNEDEAVALTLGASSAQWQGISVLYSILAFPRFHI